MMNWESYSDKWISVHHRGFDACFSTAHVSDFVIKNEDECTVYLDNGRKYHVVGKESIDKFMGCLFGDDD